MSWVPVISRELRAEARHTSAYWMRVVAGGLAIAVGAIGALAEWQSTAWKGSDAFSLLQPTLFSLIWLLGPVMTCDSISRERREGTLGLLLMTRLRPMDVGLAKACSGILRSFTIVLAILPMLALPLLMGGLAGRELLRAALMDVMALVAVTAAGLLASSRCYNFSRAAILSLIYAGFALLMLGSLPTIYFVLDHDLATRAGADEWIVLFLAGPWVLCAGFVDIWRRTGVLPATGYLWIALVQLAWAALFLVWVLRRLNRRLRSLAVEQGRTARQERWWRVWCTPRLFTGWLRRRQGWLLNRNPIGWLQRRTWTARLSMWSWMGVAVIVETAVVMLSVEHGSLSDARDPQLILACLVAVGMAFSAGDSFRVERETGALELLLVTPLRVRQIITGRLCGIWGQYALVFGLLGGIWCYTASWSVGSGRWVNVDELAQARFGILAVLVSTFLLLPIIGMHQSMLRKHFVISWLLTLTIGLVIPIGLPGSMFFAVLLVQAQSFRMGVPFSDAQLLFGFAMVAVVLQCLIAAVAAFRLYENLKGRQFALQA